MNVTDCLYNHTNCESSYWGEYKYEPKNISESKFNFCSSIPWKGSHNYGFVYLLYLGTGERAYWHEYIYNI